VIATQSIPNITPIISGFRSILVQPRTRQNNNDKLKTKLMIRLNIRLQTVTKGLLNEMSLDAL